MNNKLRKVLGIVHIYLTTAFMLWGIFVMCFWFYKQIDQINYYYMILIIIALAILGFVLDGGLKGNKNFLKISMWGSRRAYYDQMSAGEVSFIYYAKDRPSLFISWFLMAVVGIIFSIYFIFNEINYLVTNY